jgi:hypothetical protein
MQTLVFREIQKRRENRGNPALKVNLPVCLSNSGGSARKPAEYAAFCDFMGICALVG